MGLIKKLLGKSDKKELDVTASGNSIKIGDVASITFQSPTVGSSSGSSENDFYVYEWFIKSTGEIFYVGKGRGDRYKEYHERAYDAEKVRDLYDTDVRFVSKGLTEDEALELETAEMTRILNETDYCLTNVITPYFTKNNSGNSKSKNTPAFQFETAPILYARETDTHYFGIEGRPFEKVELDTLSRPHIITKGVLPEEIKIVYGGDYERYYKEVLILLEANESKLVKSKYAKSVTAWIYPCEDLVTNNDLDRKNAEERIGHVVPSYHLIDVWKLLKTEFGSQVQICV